MAKNERVELVSVADIPGLYAKELSGVSGRVLWPKIAKLSAEVGSSFETMAEVALHGMCDSTGTRIYGDGDVEKLLSEMPLRAIMAIAEATLRISGLTKDEAEKIEKN